MGIQNVLPSIMLLITGLVYLLTNLGTYPQTHGSYMINNDPKLTDTFTFDSSEEMSSGFSVG